MGVLDGQPVNQTVTNAAFMDKNANTFTVGTVSLQAPTAVSGPFIADTQKTINAFVQGASGVFTLAVTGNPVLTGAVILAPSGVAGLQQTGNNIYIYAPPSGAAVNHLNTLVGDVTLTASGSTVIGASGQSINIYTPPSGSAVNSLAGASGTPLTGALNLTASGSTVIQESSPNIIIYTPASGAAVNSIAASGNTPLTGAVTLAATGNVGLNQTSQSIYIYDTIPPSLQISSTAIDWSVKNTTFYSSVTANINYGMLNVVDGKNISFAVTNTGSFTVGFTAGTAVKWAASAAPTATVNGTDVYTFLGRGTTIYGSVVQNLA